MLHQKILSFVERNFGITSEDFALDGMLIVRVICWRCASQIPPASSNLKIDLKYKKKSKAPRYLSLTSDLQNHSRINFLALFFSIDIFFDNSSYFSL